MLVNETKNDFENNYAVTKQLTKNMRLVVLVSALALLALGAASLAVTLVKSGETEYYDIFLIVLGAVFFVLWLLMPLILKRTLSKQMAGKEPVNTYTFEEEKFHIVTTAADASAESDFGYGALYGVREYADYWLLYYNKANMYIVRKDGMKEGTAEELKALLLEKAPQYLVKFRDKKKPQEKVV